MPRNPFSRRQPIPEEEAYLRLVKKGYRPASVLDVGAYEGNWTRLAKRCFPLARILMCEAQPGKRPSLEKVCAELDGVELVSAVMSSAAGKTVEFNEMETGSSIYPENSNVTRNVIRLTTQTLDDVATNFPGPCFLKIDVQGAELDVLEGAAQTIGRCDLIQLEIAMMEYNKGAPTFLDVLTYMNGKDFVPYDVAGWSRPNGVDLVQMDLLFVPRQSPFRKSYFEF